MLLRICVLAVVDYAAVLPKGWKGVISHRGLKCPKGTCKALGLHVLYPPLLGQLNKTYKKKKKKKWGEGGGSTVVKQVVCCDH